MRPKQFFALTFMLCTFLALTACMTVPPLTQAAYDGDANRVRALLASGADPNKVGISPGIPMFGQPLAYDPLTAAVVNHHASIVQILLEGGANPNGTSYNPLIAAIYNEPTKNIIGLLLSAGADPNRKNKAGHTVLQIAEERNPGIAAFISSYEEQKEKSEEAYLAAYDAKQNLKKEKEKQYQQAKDRALAALKKGRPFPPVSEAYRREMVMGIQDIRDARGAEDYQSAFDHFLEASKMAPWAPQPYAALGHVAESLKEYDRAIEFLKLYLRVDPKAPDARSIQDHIYVLEDKVGKE